MITYKLNLGANGWAEVSVNKYIDGTQIISIPFDPANTDYQEFLRWCEQGNIPLPADE